MRQLFFVAHQPLDQDLREDLAHKSVEVGVTLPQFEVFLMEQHERDHDFQHALLVVYTIRLAVEGCYEFQVVPRALLLEEGLAAAGTE